MSELLTSKYRPNTLARVKGNTEVVNAIKNILENKRKYRTILLQGPSGCGKTTLARLIAKGYLCENEEVSGPCEVCDTCKNFDYYIQTGNFDSITNLHEIDIADKSGKNDLNFVIEDSKMPSITGGYKVYIFDEVHRATEGLQSQLLKLIEETDEDSKSLFILCTTEPKKLINTIKTRSNILDVKPMNVTCLVELLAFICKKENISFDDTGIRYIARKAKGSARMAINDLATFNTMCNSVKYDDIKEHIVSFDKQKFIYMLEALNSKDRMKYTVNMYALSKKMPFEQLIPEMIDFIEKGIQVYYGLTPDSLTVDAIKMYSDLFKRLDIEVIITFCKELEEIKDKDDLSVRLLLLGHKYEPKITSPVVHEEKHEPQIIESVANEQASLANEHNEIKEQKEVTDLFGKVSLEDILGKGGAIVS